MATVTSIITAKQLFDSSDFGPCELIRGELVMMSPAGFEHGKVAGNAYHLLREYIQKNPVGIAVAAETGFQISREPDTVRAPDVGFVLTDRVPKTETPGFFQGAPDLAVEVLSPNDRASDVTAKVQEWLQAGCREAWVIDPKTRTVQIHRGDCREITLLQMGDTVTSEKTLPGFASPVAAFFRN